MSQQGREAVGVRMVASVGLAKGLGAAAYGDVALSLEEAGRSIEGVARSHVGVHFDFSVGGGDQMNHGICLAIWQELRQVSEVRLVAD